MSGHKQKSTIGKNYSSVKQTWRMTESCACMHQFYSSNRNRKKGFSLKINPQWSTEHV